MNVVIANNGSLRGEMTVPGDKSISHRALILAALAEGTSEISGLLMGKDCRSTLECLEAMGLRHTVVNEQKFSVEGLGLEGLREPCGILNCGNSGTTMRLLMGVVSGLDIYAVMAGDNSLNRRPMDRVAMPLSKMGAKIWGRENCKYAPLSIRGGKINAIDYQSTVASAQVKSAILLAGLFAEGITSVNEPYISRDHTERMLEGFGAEIKRNGSGIAVIGRPKLQGQKITVPGDISSAAFFIAAASIIPGSQLVIKNVGLNNTRIGILNVLKEMGGRYEIFNKKEIAGEPIGDIVAEYSELHGITIEEKIIPSLIDEIPIIAVAATQAEGETLIKGAGELRVKETDRLAAIKNNLTKLGAEVEEYPEGLLLKGRQQLKGAALNCGEDHRMAMSMAIAALCAKGETTIAGADSVEISFPGFFEKLSLLQNSLPN